MNSWDSGVQGQRLRSQNMFWPLEHDISGLSFGNFFTFWPVGLEINWLDFSGQRSKVTVTSYCFNATCQEPGGTQTALVGGGVQTQGGNSSLTRKKNKQQFLFCFKGTVSDSHPKHFSFSSHSASWSLEKNLSTYIHILLCIYSIYIQYIQ